MRASLIILVLFFSFHFVEAQPAAVVKFDRIQKILDTASPQIQVINFWATWCAPCVKELPLFEQLNAEKRPDIKVTLISLDFADQIDKVNAFINRRKMKAEVLLLDELDYNAWIDKVDDRWSGALPATLILNPKTGKRKFIERELHPDELQKLVAELL